MEHFLSHLQKFISFKSISTDSNYRTECENTAYWLQELLQNTGFETIIDKAEHSNPLLLARYIDPENTETVMIYGHYDIQPEGIISLWTHEPFSLTETDNRYFGRGVVDNKGQIMIHISTILQLIQNNKLKYNIVFVIEGNEESGNPDLEHQLEKYASFIQSDYLIISDGELMQGHPCIEASFRGGVNMKLQLSTAENDLHSGLYGGVVPNAAQVLSTLLASLYDEEHNIRIKHFPKNIPQEYFLGNEYDQLDIQKITGTQTLFTHDGLDIYTQTGMSSCIEITGLKSGYTGQGFLNSIPKNAEARLNVRVAPGQSTQEILELIKKHLQEQCPSFAEIIIETYEPYEPIMLNLDSPKIDEIKKILEDIYQKPVRTRYVGGSIPIIKTFAETLNLTVISLPLANEDCNMHGIDENFDGEYIKKGLAFSHAFFAKRKKA